MENPVKGMSMLAIAAAILAGSAGAAAASTGSTDDICHASTPKNGLAKTSDESLAVGGMILSECNSGT